MTKEEVLKKLATINYPGFSRDIISFGMVKDTEIIDDRIVITLNISTKNEDKKTEVIKAIKTILKNGFNEVEVALADSSSTPNAPLTPQKSVLSDVKNIIAVASGKGGVGKSTVAVNLACSLVKKGLKVGLLDLDIYGPSLPIALGINEQPKMTNDKKLIPLEKYGMKVMSFGFISGNETPVIWRGPLVSRMTEQFFKDVEWGDLDFMILDLPPGTGDIQLTLTQKLKMTGAVVVTTPQDMALADVRKGADMFSKVNTPVLGVIENMSGLSIEGSLSELHRDTKLKINKKIIKISEDGKFKFILDLFKKGGGERECKRLNVPLLGKIPILEKIMLATDGGVPITAEELDSPTKDFYIKITENLLKQINSQGQ